MIRNHIMRLCIMLAVLLATACNTDQIDAPVDRSDAYAIAFDFSVLDPKVRAVGIEQGDKYDPLNENKIENIHMFFYEGEVQRDYFSSVVGDLEYTGNTINGTATAYIPKDSPVNPHPNKTYQMYVVVNYPNNATSLEHLTLTQLKQLVHTTPSLQAQTTTVQKQASFLMDGTVNTGLIRWVAGSKIYHVPTTVELSRAAAKIRLLIDKIQVTSKDGDFELVGDPMVALVNGRAKTTLLAGHPVQNVSGGEELFETQYQPMSRKVYEGKEFYARTVPFYSYENDWSTDSDLRTHLSVKLRLRGPGNAPTIKEFYYNIPINYLVPSAEMDAQEKAGVAKAQRNHLYEIHSDIFQLGELDPGKAEELKAWISIEDWNATNAIDGSISNAHYLVVKELTPEMPHMTVRDIEYISDLPLDQTILNDFTAEFTGYDYLGEPYTVSGKTETWGRQLKGPLKQYFKNIKISTIEKNGKKYIRVENPIPNNYVPWIIKFRAQHVRVEGETAVPLYKDIVVTQYPPVYVTAHKSKGNEIYWYSSFGAYNPSGLNALGETQAGYQTNNTCFKVHILVPQEGMIVGDPTLGSSDGKTNRGEEANKMVSPEFVIASQFGMSNPVPQYGGSGSGDWQQPYNYDLTKTIGNANDHFFDPYQRKSYRYRDYWDAESRASRYWEDEYGKSIQNKVIRGDDYYGYSDRGQTQTYSKTFKYEGSWRIPTLAELALIVSIQSDDNSAVKNLLWGNIYWSARTNYAYDFKNKRNLFMTDNQAIRPVFDTYNK